jgi:hypothetical protein
MIEEEQSFVVEGGQELVMKKGLPAVLSPTAARPRTRCGSAKGVGDELRQVLWCERRQRDLVHDRSGFANGVELPHQRMGGIHFVIPIGADDQQILDVRLREQLLEQVEGRRIEPLEIVDEERERMFRPREHPKEPLEDQLKPALRLSGRQIGEWRLFSDDQLQFLDKVDHQLAVRGPTLR